MSVVRPFWEETGVAGPFQGRERAWESMNRREFLKRAGAAGAASTLPAVGRADQSRPPASTDRGYWVTVMRRLADPVPPQLWTSAKAWSGASFPIDHALAP
jgi:hypothetical protein